MDALSVNALGPATLSALSALRPVLPLAVPPPAQTEAGAGLSFQDVAQGLLQRSVQAAVADPAGEVPTGFGRLLGDTGTSLLASLAAPQPPVQATPAPQAATESTAPSTTAASATPSVLAPTAPQEAFAGSATLDFALQTALRFGAGVGAAAPAVAPNPVLDAGLVRDATAVPRLEGLQAREGGPGAESYRQLPAAPPALRAYGAAAPAPATAGAGRLDLMA